jgi:hypothetical protein
MADLASADALPLSRSGNGSSEYPGTPDPASSTILAARYNEAKAIACKRTSMLVSQENVFRKLQMQATNKFPTESIPGRHSSEWISLKRKRGSKAWLNLLPMKDCNISVHQCCAGQDLLKGVGKPREIEGTQDKSYIRRSSATSRMRWQYSRLCCSMASGSQAPDSSPSA